MKKAVRLLIEGNLMGFFFTGFVKENADKNNVRGFVRGLEGGNAEIFLEGNIKDVDRMIDICSSGPRHAQIKSVKTKEEKFQGFKEFKVLHI